jgi:hypothetical protein
MDVVYLLLLLAAAICFALASVRDWSPRVYLVALGLFFWVLVPLITQIKSM